MRAGNAAGAANTCSSALKDYPGDANLLCLAAKANLVLRKFDDSKRLLDEAVRLHPDFAVAHDVVGDLLFAQGFVGAAVKAYEQALRLDPTSSGALVKIERAQELIKVAEKAGPQAGEVPAEARRMAFADEINQAEQFTRNGDSKRAEDIFRSILKRDPNHVEAARLLAKIAAD